MTITEFVTELDRDQQLEAMEALWTAWSASPDQAASPAWHGEVLQQRRRKIEDGTAVFRDWETVRTELAARYR